MHVQGGRVSNPTYASPTLHTAPLPQIPFILTLISLLLALTSSKTAP
jgi:hypothetical protein